MNVRVRLAVLTAVLASVVGGDLFACGDKFLAAGRGTRYQRSKTARAASIVIYADPSSNLPATFANARVQALLARQGHRTVTVTTFEQLATLLTTNSVDVVIAGKDVVARLQRLMTKPAEAAVVVAFDAAPKPTTLLTAIDKAVAKRDRDVRRNAS